MSLPTPTSSDPTNTPGIPDYARARTTRSRRTAQLLEQAGATDDPQDCRALQDEAIVLNRCVADAIATRYRNRGIPLEDLRQVANEGLVKAVLRFDVTRGQDLLTYAVPTIRGEIQRYFRDQGWMVRPPRRIQDLQRAINHTSEEFASAHGRPPQAADIIGRLGLTQASYSEAMTAFGAFSPLSLDHTVGEDSTTSLADTVGADDADRHASEARTMLAPAIRRLPPRDREILFMRYFLDMTQQEIGTDQGVTQTQVSRLLHRIHRRLESDLVPAGADRD